RLLLPDAELVISTREPARLRDRLIPLGVTRMSAGSRTTPGAYGTSIDDAAAGQFSTDDRRSVAELARAIRAAGYAVVTKDFDPAFLGPERAA
ncbi:MAG: 2-iminoacetate synthase ThiH, partial [Deltaproteobacteria bacterium]